jgi:hypothetical protein
MNERSKLKESNQMVKHLPMMMTNPISGLIPEGKIEMMVNMFLMPPDERANKTELSVEGNDQYDVNPDSAAEGRRDNDQYEARTDDQGDEIAAPGQYRPRAADDENDGVGRRTGDQYNVAGFVMLTNMMRRRSAKSDSNCLLAICMTLPRVVRRKDPLVFKVCHIMRMNRRADEVVMTILKGKLVANCCKWVPRMRWRLDQVMKLIRRPMDKAAKRKKKMNGLI